MLSFSLKIKFQSSQINGIIYFQLKMGRKQKNNEEKDKCYTPYQRRKLKKKKKNVQQKFNSFLWSIQEEKLYVDYLQNHRPLFVNMEQRKKSKVFVLMSRFIKLRGPDQCRSHHQKMCKKYGSLDQIIQGIAQDKINSLNLDCPEVIQIEQANQVEKQIFEKVGQNQTNSAVKEPIIKAINSPQSFVEDQSELWEFIDQRVWIRQ